MSSDDDLDDLDDYLDEFQDEILSKPAEELARESEEAKKQDLNGKEENKNQDTLGGNGLPDNLQGVLEELQNQSPEAKALFESLLKNAEDFDKQTGGEDQSFADPMDEWLSQANAQKQETTPTNLKDTVSSTLNRLKESKVKVDQSIKDEDNGSIEELLKQLGLGEGGSDDFNIEDLLGDLLGQLASKAVLYEPLKDLNVKYPEWIAKNKETITDEELIRYTNQSEIVQSLVAKFEESDYSDESKPHKEFISTKLEEMQNSGNPPADLMDDLNKTGLPGFQFNGDDLPADFGKDMEKELDENCQQQ